MEDEKKTKKHSILYCHEDNSEIVKIFLVDIFLWGCQFGVDRWNQGTVRIFLTNQQKLINSGVIIKKGKPIPYSLFLEEIVVMSTTITIWC